VAKSSRVKLKAGEASGPRKGKVPEACRFVVLAIGAHPDDIEFMMGGTLVLLGRAGCETHYMSVASGSCGSSVHGAGELRVIRRQEAESAARILGARHHVSLVDDLEVLYEMRTIRRLAAVMREVRPEILLVPSPEDYMEDHVNTARLAVTAAFARGMRNFRTRPPRVPVAADVTVYHAMPHGLKDPLRRRIWPGAYVDVTSVRQEKEAALAAHRSQHDWLAASQKMSGPLREMEGFAKEVGRMSGRFERAEGWRRRLHYGFCEADADPMAVVLGRRYWVDRRYEAALRKGC
jgi:N-acetylglucosamine malate deacetylase 1